MISENNDKSVSCELKEIKFYFDREMDPEGV